MKKIPNNESHFSAAVKFQKFNNFFMSFIYGFSLACRQPYAYFPLFSPKLIEEDKKICLHRYFPRRLHCEKRKKRGSKKKNVKKSFVNNKSTCWIKDMYIKWKVVYMRKKGYGLPYQCEKNKFNEIMLRKPFLLNILNRFIGKDDV